MPEKHRIVTKRIGELLIERGVITQEQLHEALRIQEEEKNIRLLGEILIDLGYATEEEVITSLTTQYGMPFLPLESYEIDPEVIKSVPADLVHKYDFVPIDKMGDLLTIVISDVPNGETTSQIEEKLGCKVECFVTTPSALRKEIEKYYG